jgi:hypothetical protein
MELRTENLGETATKFIPENGCFALLQLYPVHSDSAVVLRERIGSF